jgi:hypothetical protein
MPKRTTLRKRETGFRDARLVFVATEGQETEPAYFEALKRLFVPEGSRLHVIVLPTIDGRSAPGHLVERLDAAAREYRLGELRDEFWLVGDVDDWKVKTFAAVATLARQKGYELAISNPCFELWLLLHFRAEVTSATTADACERALREALGGSYNKANLRAAPFSVERVNDAVARAEQLDAAPAEPWPTAPPVTRVYRLVRSIRLER